MYAIVEIAGQQFKVQKDQQIHVHRLQGNEGDSVVFDNVLLIDNDGSVNVGAPAIEGAAVTAKILKHHKGDKVIVFKKKRRKGYAVKNGHRQYLTELQIEEIAEKGGKKATKKKAAPKKKKEEKVEEPVAEVAAPVEEVVTPVEEVVTPVEETPEVVEEVTEAPVEEAAAEETVEAATEEATEEAPAAEETAEEATEEAAEESTDEAAADEEEKKED
jgi:large subunit ribosomal protein L21